MEKKLYWIVVLFTSDLLKIKLFPIQKNVNETVFKKFRHLMF
jgi:hypothetical protein